MPDLHTLAKTIASARCPEDVYGDLEGNTVELASRELAKAHRRIVVVIHPDRHVGVNFALANNCFRQLEIFHALAQQKIAQRTYGDRKPIAAAEPPRPAFETQIVKTPKTEYVVERPIAQGDLADIYFARAGRSKRACAFKLAQHPGDNDLLEHEARILSLLKPGKDDRSKRGYKFIPEIFDTFTLRSSTRTMRRVNVIEYAEGHVSLAEILEGYPSGLDFRDVVWIFKRMLYSLWFVHSQIGTIHGSVVLPHVLVHPTEHSAKLVDWCYAVSDWPRRAQHVRAISKPYRAYCAPEILLKTPPTPSTDIYMAAKCALALLGGNTETNAIPRTVPVPIQAFLQGCMLASQSKRPNDAGALHEEFDDLLLRIVGKPTYRPLAMPGK